MAFEDRSYSGNAVPATLTTNINNTDTTINISVATGWPDGTSGPFHIRIDSETIRISGRVGNALSVQTVPVNGRGWDGTTAAAHIVPAAVTHVFTATDADEANQHIANPALDHHSQYLTVARHDQASRHGFGILPTAGTPSTSAVGDTAQSGASNNVAKVDHKHAREGFGPALTSGPVNVDGALTSLSRSDHKHAGGIPIIANAAARNATPTTAEVQLEANSFRAVMWTGSRWQRGPYFARTGRTEVILERQTAYSIPNGGASSYILPWDTEIVDTDTFMPTPDATTTTTCTIPNLETEGLYAITAFMIWGSAFTQRSYLEIIHGQGGSFFQHRIPLTGEDRGTQSITIPLFISNTIQVGIWQNSGGAVNVSYCLFTMHRMSP